MSRETSRAAELRPGVRFVDVTGMMHTTLTGACPACHQAQAFEGPYRIRPVCTNCGVRFERDEGSFLGALAVAYGLTVLLVAAVATMLVVRWGLFEGLAFVLIGVGVVGVPLLYRSAKAWWLWWLWAAGFVLRDDDVAVKRREGR